MTRGVGFFCFHALGDTKQKKPTPLNRGPPLHVNRPLESKTVNSEIVMPDLWRHYSPRLPSDSQKLCSIWDYLDCRFNFNHLTVDYYPSLKGQAVLQEITNLYIIILPPEILYLYFLLFYI